MMSPFFNPNFKFNTQLDPNSWKWGGGINYGFEPKFKNQYQYQAPKFNQMEQYQQNAAQFGSQTGTGNIGQSALTVGDYAESAMGAAQVIGGAFTMDDEAKAINTDAPRLEMDANDTPVYNLGQRSIDVSNIKPRGASFGEIASSAGAGAKAGGAFGAAGAAIGAVGGAIAAGIGGAFRKRAMRKKKQAATRKLNRAKARYSQAYQTSMDQQRSIEAYYYSINTQNRLYNLYNR